MAQPKTADLLGLDWGWNGAPFVVRGKSVTKTDPTEWFFNGAGVYSDGGPVVAEAFDSAACTEALNVAHATTLMQQVLTQALPSAAGSSFSVGVSISTAFIDAVFVAFLDLAESMTAVADSSASDHTSMLNEFAAVIAAVNGSSATSSALGTDSANTADVSALLRRLFNLSQDQLFEADTVVVGQIGRPSAIDRAAITSTPSTSGSSLKSLAVAVAQCVAVLRLYWERQVSETAATTDTADGVFDIGELMERILMDPSSASSGSVLGLSAASLAAITEKLAVHWNMSATDAASVLSALTSSTSLKELVERLALVPNASSVGSVIGLSASSAARLVDLLATVWDMDTAATAQALATLSSIVDIRALVERIAVQVLTSTQGSSFSGYAATTTRVADLLAIVLDEDAASSAQALEALTSMVDVRALVERIVVQAVNNTRGSALSGNATTVMQLTDLLAAVQDMDAASAAQALGALSSALDIRALVERVALLELASTRGSSLSGSATTAAQIADLVVVVWEDNAVSSAQALAALSSMVDVRELVEKVVLNALSGTQGSALAGTATTLVRLIDLLALVQDMDATSAAQALGTLSSVLDVRALVERMAVQALATSRGSSLAGDATTAARIADLMAVVWDDNASSSAQALTTLSSIIDVRALVDRVVVHALSATRGSALSGSATTLTRLIDILALLQDMDAASAVQALATLSSIIDIRALVEQVAVQALASTRGSSFAGAALAAAQLAELLAVVWDLDGASAAAFVPALAYSIDLRVLTERVLASESLVTQATQRVTAASLIRASDALRLVWDALAAESSLLSDVGASDPLRMVALAESLRASSAVSSRIDASVALAIAAMFRGASQAPPTADIVEMFTASESWSAKLVGNAVLIEAMLIASDLAAGRAALLTAACLATLAPNATAAQILQALAADAAGVNVELLLGGESYEGWVVRTDTLAPSQYLNYPFNSMCRLGQRYFGASEEGFFELDGDSDDGQPIQARILTGELDFGTPEMKRIERAYLGYTTNGDLVLKVIATHAGKKSEYWYRAPMLVRDEATETRVKIGRGIVSRYFQFELVNVDGADFDLDRMDLEVLNLSRRL